jgi:hypothetical protein
VPLSLSPEERRMRARVAALTMHSRNDVMVVSAPGRETVWKKFLDQVDPLRQLPEEERNRRAKIARRAHMTRLAYKSARARRAGAS